MKTGIALDLRSVSLRAPASLRQALGAQLLVLLAMMLFAPTQALSQMLVYNTEDSNDAPSQTILDFQRDVAQGFGMGGHSDGFQWIRVDDDGKSNAADIAGAASNAHTPVEADVGKKVRVEVSFTDDGICGRTPQVRDALLAEISGVSDCADVTATHLAAISGNLGLNDTGITALAAGDFAGLTALERLNLSFNELTTLDAGVFAELTALEYLYLNDNDLTTLDAGDFAGLTALERLYLDDNDLTTLSDDVFEELTALTRLDLRDNPGAPFAPEAVALPDDGKIPFAGGTLTLDGSGSGGAWGTNVTYGWALTNPASGVTVTFDDAASATTVVTIPALTADTELTFTLTVTGRGGRDGIAPATDTAEVKVTAPPPQAIVIEADWPKATGKIDWVRYTLTREGDPAQPVTVPVTFEGFAGNDWNLDIDSREVTFGAGSRTATQAILLSSTGDNNIGFSLSATQSGTLTARLGAVAGYDTSDTAEVQVVVIDGPAWVIRLTETAYTFTEDGGDQTIVVEATAASADMPAPSLDAGNNSVLGASVTAEGGTARIVQDYAPLNSVKYFESLECSAGSGVQVCQAEVTFTPVDDDLVEPDETLTLELARLPGNSSAIHYQGPDGTVSTTIKVYPATITDDDGPAMQAAAVEFAPALTPEGDAITFTVTLAEGATRQVTVDYATSVASDDTAAQTDFTAGSGTLTFAMGETEQTFTVSTLEDRIHESDETFTVTLDNVSPAGAATLPADPTATGTIVDDDDAPVLVLSVDSASIAEAGGTSTVTVSTGTGSTFPDEQTITLALSGTATETDDYTISSKSLTLSAGVGSGASSVTATVTAVDDALFEGDETVIITASHGANTIGSQTVTITDAAPAIVIEADWPKATGKIDWVRYTLTREGDPAQPVTVPVTFEGFAGNDWNLDIDSREVTFGAGSRTATQAILLSSTGDNNIGFSLSATQSGTLTARLGAVAGYDTSDTAEVQVVVIDGPAWVIRLTETAYTFTEDGGDQTIVVEATAASADMPAPSLDAGNNSVLGASVTAEGGTARIVQDYAPLNSVKYFESLECSAGSGVQVCQAEVTFTPVDDDLVEPDETLTLELARLPGNSSAIHYQGPDGTVSPTIKVYPATITDDDGPAMQAAAVEFAPALTPEGDAITFTVTLAEGATQQVTVDYATSVASDDTAAQTDFTAGSGTLTFAMGETEQTFTVSTLEDRIHESDETFTVTLDNVSPAGAATLPADPTATGTIVDDDDAPVLVLSVDSASIAEAGGTSTVTVSTGTGSTFPDEQTITLALSGTATETDDYTISSKSLTLSAGVGSGASSVTATVTAVDDALFEGDETVIITASHGANTIGSQTVTITDAAPAIVIEADWPKATGKIDWVRYTLTREGDPAQPVTVPVTFEGFAGNDWNLDIDSREVTFGAGSRTATQAILLSSTGDNNIGFSLSATQSGTLTARLGAVAGYDTSDTAEVQVVVIDGPAWVIRLTETAYTFTEDGGDQTIVVEATAASADMPAPSLDAGNNSVLGASVTAEGGTARIVQDYAPLNSVKYFESLECSAGSGVQVCQAEVTFTPVDDDLVEPDETLTLELARLPGNSSAIHYQGPDGTVSPTIKVYPATITDDDGPAMQAAAVEFAPALTPEGDAITFTVTLAEGATQQVTVDYATSVASDDTAAQTDFTAGSGTLTFAMGETEQTFTVSTLEDRIHESDETFTVTLDNVSPAGAATLPADPTATGTIVDDDDAPVLVLSVDSASIAEAGGTSTVTVSTGTGSTFPDEQTITLALSGTATETDDYTISSKSLTLSAGVGSGASSVTATVTAVDDALFEGDETLVISGQADGAAFGEQQTLTITDNEEAPRVTLVLSPDSIAEAGGVSTLTATVSPASAEAFTVTVTATADAPATEADFTLSGASLSFAANATGSTGEVTIAAVDNDVDAADKTVRVSGSVSLPGVLAPAEATLTIVDGDTVAVLTLEVAPATIAEDGGTATVTVTTGTGSTFGSAQAITLVLGGTATQGEDYTVSATQLTLPADTASVTATVTAVDDGVFEGDETLVISGQAGGAAFGEQQTLTITDNEEAPRVTLVLSPDSIAEAGGVSTLTATVSPASAEAFTVTVTATADAPATEADFTLSGASLSFAANATGSTGEVTIAAVDNDVDAADKMVTVSGTVSRDNVTAPASVTITINDDDEPPPPVQRGVDISQQALAIVEGDEAGSTFQVKLIAQPSEPVAVAMLAPPGSGLTVVPPVLRFTPANWNIAQTVTVTAADAADTNPRTVLLSFAASGAGYEDVPVTPLPVTVNDPVLPELRVADARGREAGGQLVFDLTLNRTAEQAVSVAYATRDGTARAGEDYDAQAGVATIAAGERGARIAVPVRVDLFREPDEFFLVTLSGVNGARLADGEATGVIEDEAAMASQWLARFGRLAGDHVMAAVEEQISAPRGDASQVTVSGYRLSADTGAFDTGARQLDPLGQPGFGRGPSPGPVAGGIAAAGFGSASAGSAFGAAGRTLSGRDLLANSSFRLNAGPGGGQGASVWGRADYTRFDHLGEDLQGGGDALSATVGVDWACGRCLIGIALSHTAVEAGYGAAGQESGTLESSVTGLYPYFGLQLAERFSVWGLAGLGQGELIPAPETGARTEKLDIETGLAGLGARAELLSPDKAFSLAVKTDAFVSRATSEEAAGILEAEGEWRRVRLGLEGSWLAEFDTGASLRSSLEMGALQDAGDAENGLGAEVGASLQLIDVTPGLSLSLSVRGLVSHESEDYEEWGGSGGLRYDPEPASAAGLMVSLTHSWGAAQSGGLQQALRGNGLSRPPTPLLARREEQLSAEFAYGFEAFGALGIPWARFGTTGAGKDFGVGYSLSTHRGLFSLEHGQSALGRETRLGWAFTVRCRAQVTAQVLHAAGGPGGRTNTGLEITFRSRAPGGRRRGASCDQRQPLFTSVAPR